MDGEGIIILLEQNKKVKHLYRRDLFCGKGVNILRATYRASVLLNKHLLRFMLQSGRNHKAISYLASLYLEI